MIIYRKQIEEKIGNTLRDEGSKIVREEASAVGTQRQRDARSFNRGKRSPGSTKCTCSNRDFGAVHERSALKRREASPSEAQLTNSQNQSTVNRQRWTGRRAAIADARKAILELTGKDDALGSKSRAAIAASGGRRRASRNVSKRADGAAKAGDAVATERAAGEAADAAGAFADAIHAARDAAGKENDDPANAARLAVKHARDDVIRDEVDHSFQEQYANRTLPRLTDKLTGVFRQTLKQADP